MIIFTPSSIKECVTHDDDTPVDCFDDAVPQDNPYHADLVAMLWARWRYVPISSVCLDRWLQRVKDRAAILDKRYRIILEEFEGQKDKLASIRMGWTETRDLTHTSTPSGSDVRVSTSEDIPQVQDSASSTWLTGRTRDTSTPGVTVTDTDTGTVEHTDNSVLNAEEWSEVLDKLEDPYVRYAGEFSDLFLDYFELDCGCDCSCRRVRSNCSRCPAP